MSKTIAIIIAIITVTTFTIMSNDREDAPYSSEYARLGADYIAVIGFRWLTRPISNRPMRAYPSRYYSNGGIVCRNQ